MTAITVHYGEVACPSRALVLIDADSLPAEVAALLDGTAMVVRLTGTTALVAGAVIHAQPIALNDRGDTILDALATNLTVEVLP